MDWSRHARVVDVASLPSGTLAITATTTRHEQLRKLGARPTTSWEELTTNLVISLPGSALQAEALERLRGRPVERAVYVSTVGFHFPYKGNVHAGSCPGSSERASVAAMAEQRFSEWAGSRGVILRLGGLHAAGRGPSAVFQRRGTVRATPGNARLPLIHYADAAQRVMAALEGRTESVVLGVSEAPKRRHYYTTLAQRHGLQTPDFEADQEAFDFDVGPARSLLSQPALGPKSW